MVVSDQETARAAPADGVEELEALAHAGGFWRLAPMWVPRTGYASPTPELLRVVEAGLQRRPWG
jgi:hypothetical protein